MDTSQNNMKVLQVGAHEELLINYYRHFKSGNVLFDYVLRKGGEDFRFKNDPIFDGELHYLTPLQVSPLKYIKELRQIVRFGKYSHVHLHAGWANIYGLFACLGLKVVTISHNHSFYCPHNRVAAFLRFFSKMAINLLSDYKFACSRETGTQMFIGNHRILPNAIDYKRFVFDANKRKVIRGCLNISDRSTVFGHVGNFYLPKNHVFLIYLFRKLKCALPGAKLILVGADYGTLDEVRRAVDSLGLREDVIFMGKRSDVEDILCAVDVFILPSIQEGFPLALLEAQASGLPCIFSSAIPADAAISNAARIYALDEGLEFWATHTLDLLQFGTDDHSRLSRIEQLPLTYDVARVAGELEEFYLSTSREVLS
jgi:glycosyltransferase involved in cell wall biosynthesis